MNPHDAATARKALLARWLEVIDNAIDSQACEQAAIRDAANGEPYDIPPLTIPMPSKDMLEVLRDVLAKAQDARDPRGIKARKSRAVRVEAVLQVKCLEAGGMTQDEALRVVGARFGMSHGTLRAAYFDKEIAQAARIRDMEKQLLEGMKP